MIICIAVYNESFISHVTIHVMKWNKIYKTTVKLLPDTQNCVLRMRRERRECFPSHRGLAIPTSITARSSCTCRYACWDHWLAVSFEVDGGETFPTFPAHAQPAILRICKRPIQYSWERLNKKVIVIVLRDICSNAVITGYLTCLFD